jgi:hypothetical protein
MTPREALKIAQRVYSLPKRETHISLSFKLIVNNLECRRFSPQAITDEVVERICRRYGVDSVQFLPAFMLWRKQLHTSTSSEATWNTLQRQFVAGLR